MLSFQDGGVMLDQKLAQAMQTVLASEKSSYPVNAALKRLVTDFSIGRIRGKSVYFTSMEREEIQVLLSIKGYSLEKVSLSQMDRNQRLNVTPYEKAGGGPVKKNRVSIKSLAGQPLLIGTQPIHLPDHCHIDADWTRIADQIGHRCVMVVENYENFNFLHKVRFDLPEQYGSPLVIYRGDPGESRYDNVLAMLEKLNLHVLAFVDADLAGINIACSMPGLVGMVAPDLQCLEKQLSSPAARTDLFQAQYTGLSAAMERLESSHPCFPLWNLISRYKACDVQERWIDSGLICSFNN
jgi:hypothetical protein